MQKVQTSFIERAIALAEESIKSGGGPFGCVIVRDEKIIAEGSNQVTDSNDPTAHAEIVAIREACKKLGDFQLSDCDVYCSCEPCPMCLGAIYWARPKRVIFASLAQEAAEAGFDDQFIYREIPLTFKERSIPFIHQPHQKAVEVFESWKHFAGRKEY